MIAAAPPTAADRRPRQDHDSRLDSQPRAAAVISATASAPKRTEGRSACRAIGAGPDLADGGAVLIGDERVGEVFTAPVDDLEPDDQSARVGKEPS